MKYSVCYRIFWNAHLSMNLFFVNKIDLRNRRYLSSALTLEFLPIFSTVLFSTSK